MEGFVGSLHGRDNVSSATLFKSRSQCKGSFESTLNWVIISDDATVDLISRLGGIEVGVGRDMNL